MKLQWPFRREEEVRAAPDTEAKAVTFTPVTAAYEFGFGGPRAPGSNLDYASEVKNGMHSSVVTSALCWVMRTFPEAPLVVQRSVEERWETVAQHDIAKLIRRPNKSYGGRVLWMATVMDYCFGNAYWLKVRDRTADGPDGKGKVVELWWIPRGMITPMADPRTGVLDHYDYHPGTAESGKLSVDDVVHYRFGMDPRNPLLGFSPLAAVMREVYTDDQAANFTAAILKNLGIIGVIFAPETGAIPQEQATKLKDYVQQGFTGDKRAQAMMFTAPMKATLLQYNLQGFDVGPIRDISEERVCAALAIPAAVVGFGTGLQQTKVGATMREMVKLAWQGGIEPNQAIMADELDRSLLPEFQKNTDLFRTHFDTSQVEALAESPTEKTTRVLQLVKENVIKVSQAQRELGYPVDPSQDKYARELDPKPAAAPPPPNRVAAALNGSNGNGTPPGDDNA
jgi:phage portal protein BeeE